MAVGNKFAESQGLSYVPNDAYLQEDFKGSTPLDFSNISSSGIMSQAPIPLKYIQEGGDDVPIDTGPTDYGYTGPGSTGSVDGFNIDDIREGTIDDADIKNNQVQLSKMALVKAGLTGLLGPFAGATSIYRSDKKAEKKMRDKIDAEINAQYGYGSGAASQKDMDSYGVDKDTDNPGNYDQDYDMKDGGRAGYFFGGRVNYKVGGRTDAGPNRTTASKAGVGQINESGQKVSGGNFNNNNDGGNDTPTINKFAVSNVIESPFEKLGERGLKIGYRGGVDLTKLGLTMGVDGTLSNKNFLTNDDIENKGTFYTGTDNDIFNTATTYGDSGIRDTVLSSSNPYGDFGVTVDNNGNLVQGNYENNYKGVDVGATTNFDDLNNISLSKFSGDPTKNGFSYGIGANVDPFNPSNSNIFGQARYAFGQAKKDGGRISYANGGLAGLL